MNITFIKEFKQLQTRELLKKMASFGVICVNPKPDTEPQPKEPRSRSSHLQFADVQGHGAVGIPQYHHCIGQSQTCSNCQCVFKSGQIGALSHVLKFAALLSRFLPFRTVRSTCAATIPARLAFFGRRSRLSKRLFAAQVEALKTTPA